MRDVDQIELLRDLPTDRVRGDWHHYRCFKCDDRSEHLGVNWVLGRVRCLRCGFRLRLGTGGESSHQAPVKAPEDLSDRLSWVENPQSYMDRAITKYMVERGMPAPGQETGWGYGRKDAVGRVVFTARDQNGTILYLQHRSCSQGSSRYLSSGPFPRLDFYPLNRCSSSLLILVEGPTDCQKVRKAMPSLWSAPAWGLDSLGKLFLQDLSNAVEKLGLSTILIWPDNEQIADSGWKKARLKLAWQLGINIRVVGYPKKPYFKDPGSLPLAAIRKLVHSALAKEQP